VVDKILFSPEENKLIGVLPSYRKEFKEFLIKALNDLASEFRRQNILKDSIFKIKDTEDINRLKLLTEMLIINIQEIAFSMAKKLPIPEKIRKTAADIARFQDYEFIDKFLNDDEFLAEKLDMSVEEVREYFPKSLRLRFAAYNISNPLEALKRWLRGEIKTHFKRPNIKL